MSITTNKFKSTEIYGDFYNKTGNSLTANSHFEGDINLSKYETVEVEQEGGGTTEYQTVYGDPVPIYSFITRNNSTASNAQINTLANGTNSFNTVSFHFKYVSIATFPRILFNNKISLRFSPSTSGYGTKMFIQNNTTNFLGSYDLSANIWYHICVTRETFSSPTNSHSIKLYINGVIYAQTGTVVNTLTETNLYFGSNNGTDVNFYMNAHYTEIILYNRIISESEIASLYTTQIEYPVNDNSIILYYPIISTSSLNVVDKSDNAPNQSLVLSSNIGWGPVITDMSYFTLYRTSTVIEITTPSVLTYTSSTNTINYKYLDYDYSLTSKIFWHLRNLDVDLQSKLNLLDSSITNLLDETEANAIYLSITYLSNISTLESNYSTLNSSLTTTNNNVSTLTTNYNNLNSSLTTTNNNVNNNASNISTIQTNLNNYITDNNLEITNIQNDITTLETNLNTYITDNNSVITTIQNNITTNNNNLNSYITDNNSVISTIQTDISDIQTDIENINTTIGGSFNQSIADTLYLPLSFETDINNNYNVGTTNSSRISTIEDTILLTGLEYNTTNNYSYIVNSTGISFNSPTLYFGITNSISFGGGGYI